jgi:Tol biopolymer transport system component
VLLYPNPAKDYVQIALSSDKKQQLKMMVYDFTGRMVENKEFFLNQGNNVFSVNTSGMKSGTYMIQLITSTQTINQRLLIQANETIR